MNFKYLILFTFLISCVTANAQKLHSGNIHYLTLSVGNDFNLSKTTPEIPSQILHRKNFTGVSFKYSVFPLPKWGMFVETAFSIPQSISKDPSELKLKDQEQYYVDDIWYDDVNDTFHMNFGIKYRIENRHFSLLPYLGIGFSDAMVGYYSCRLKEKGGNSLYHIKYFSDDNNHLPTVGYILPGATLNYKITKYLHLSLDINYKQALKKIDIEYQKKDMYTSDIVEEKHWRKFTGQHLSIKLGLSAAFGYRKNQ
ncbi:hypothetical protein [Bacteroides sp. 224]|uniref:hypothetical protein n=1 Tax=Bacteroides sp. 224 TaxID=2302936 RepID=UPI0013D0AA93|nr:hypothetical protein [Bacteroides sp. 224]NDV65641.1 hypothetical protein [Bacteroides sp. 224]